MLKILLTLLLGTVSSYNPLYNYDLEGEGYSNQNSSSLRFENAFDTRHQLFTAYKLNENNCMVICDMYNNCEGIFFNNYDQQPTHHYCVGLKDVGNLT